MSCAGVLKSGHLYPLKGPVRVDPKKWHATMPWEGDRLIVVGYTLGSHRQLSQKERGQLKQWGFRVPWKTKTRPEQPRLRPGPSAHQGLVASSLEQDAQQQLHEQAGDAGSAHEEGRDPAIGLDEDPAQGEVDRAHGGRDSDDDREGRLQDPEPLQNQSGTPGEDGRVPARIHVEDQRRPASQSPAQALDGNTGTCHGVELCRLRQVQSVDIRRDSHACAVLQRVDSGDSDQRDRVSLASPQVRSVVPSLEPQRQDETRASDSVSRVEPGDSGSAQLPSNKAASSTGPSPGPASSTGETDVELIPEMDQSDRVTELEAELKQLKEMMLKNSGEVTNSGKGKGVPKTNK